MSMLIAVGSVKRSPGATSVAVGLAALWPNPDAVMLECDPDGGDLAARFGHHPDPGLSSLAAAGRAGRTDEPLSRHVQRLAIGVDVVLATPGDAAAASVRTLAYGGHDVLAHTAAGAVVLDVGRLSRGGPGLVLAARAEHVLLLTRPSLDDLTHVEARLDWVRTELPGRIWLVRVGTGRYPAAEMSRDLDVPVIGTIPHSRWGAGVLSGQLHIPNWRRLTLGRALRRIAETLSAAQPAVSTVADQMANAHRAEVTP
jgi:hypothetical protein